MKKIIIMILICLLGFGCYRIVPHYLSRDGLCVLGYHGVVSDEEKETVYKNDRYTLSLSEFEKQIKFLYDQGYKTYTMDDAYEYMIGNQTLDEKAVVLTFDDGYKNFNEYVLPLMQKYQMHATCFVIGKHVNDDKDKFLKADDMQNNAYVSYYSHSYNLHRKSKKGFDRKIIEDLSLKEIDADFQNDVVDSTYFAFPYGRSVEGIEEVLKKNHVKLAFSYNQLRHVTRKENCYSLPRYMIVDMMPFFYFRWVLG